MPSPSPKPLLLFASSTCEELEEQVAKHFAANHADASDYKYGSFAASLDADGDEWYTVTFYHRSFN